MTCDICRRKDRLITAAPITCLAFVALLFGLSGCGGSGGVNEGVDSGWSTYVPPEKQAPLEYPLVSPFECDSPPAEPTTQKDTDSSGIFVGYLFDCTLGVEVNATAFIADDGRFAIIRNPEDGTYDQPLTGVVTNRGNAFTGSGKNFTTTASGSGNPGALTIDGLASDKQRLDGRWRSDSGDYGYFALAYIHFGTPVTLERTLYTSTVLGPNQYGEEVNWSIAPGGGITGQDTRGCDYAGQFSLDGPSYPLLQMQVVLTGCARAGTYAGLAAVLPNGGIFSDKLVIALDDGQQQALVLNLPFQ